MPKGTDLSAATPTWRNDVARLMNGRPRKTLGWKTPAEAMAEEIKAFSSTVALEVRDEGHGQLSALCLLLKVPMCPFRSM